MARVRELWDVRTCGFRIQGISSNIMIIEVRIHPRGAQSVLVGSSEGVEGGVINDKSHHVPSPNFSHIPFPSLSFCPNPSPIFSSWFVIPTPSNPNPIFLVKKRNVKQRKQHKMDTKVCCHYNDFFPGWRYSKK